MASLVIFGYVYDIFGRRLTICMNVLGIGLSHFLMPLGAPNVFPFAYLIRGASSIFSISVTGNPLINDYVHTESRGKASALSTLGAIIGDFFNYFIILPLIANYTIGEKFQIVGILYIGFAIMLYFMIKEPIKFLQKN